MDLGGVRLDTERRAEQQDGDGWARGRTPPPDVLQHRTASPSTPHHEPARHLRRLRHPLSTCCLASRWKEDMAFLRSFYVADDIWRFA